MDHQQKDCLCIALRQFDLLQGDRYEIILNQTLHVNVVYVLPMDDYHIIEYSINMLTYIHVYIIDKSYYLILYLSNEFKEY